MANFNTSGSLNIRALFDLNLARALFNLNLALPPGQALNADSVGSSRQQQLSRALDKGSFEARRAGLTPADQAQLLSECCAGSYNFLEAVPNKQLGKAMDGPEFCCTLAERLCVKTLAEDQWCPLCDEILDSRLRHPCRCVAGGEKTIRHHKARNLVYQDAVGACMNPELEKSDLLLPARPDDIDAGRRRPADVYVPLGWNGTPMALDFAVTCPTRQEGIAAASTGHLAAAKAYSTHKRNYLDTASQCQRSGVEFVPMVAESTGAWSDEARAVFHFICQRRSRWSGRSEEVLFQDLLQRLSVAIRSANARAVLRRVGELGDRLQEDAAAES